MIQVQGLDLWLNEEGLFEGLPLNLILAGHEIHGTVFAAGYTEDGATVGLANVARWIYSNEPRRRVNEPSDFGEGDAGEVWCEP